MKPIFTIDPKTKATTFIHRVDFTDGDFRYWKNDSSTLDRSELLDIALHKALYRVVWPHPFPDSHPRYFTSGS